ncbi:uncharacterized protein EV422DRAFT_108444 [Fimicolochytrium jonesii]|uniref:uncharacterized protein n=1 Tax=Fimicolochytrium jonesii TaxID=1396493 RepID=UPI0022FEEA11|nr:uncharacterized protein EV422DRAFT_108444 [Fimicolochytrium jonesii]KAI8819330.1 hypothetical protein EV422DRAFT_108444 [Fimicolochytrium jonesii]
MSRRLSARSEVDTLQKAISPALYVASTSSIILCTVALSTAIYIRRTRPDLASRVSFRLAGISLWGSIIYSASLILIQQRPSDLICMAGMALMVGSELASVFATSVIALNLLFVFAFHLSRCADILNKCHTVLVFFASVAIPMIALGLGSFNKGIGECWFNGESPQQLFANEWAFLYTRKRSTLAEDRSKLDGTSTNTRLTMSNDRHVRQGIARIAIYCLVPLCSQAWNLIYDVFVYLYTAEGVEPTPQFKRAAYWAVFLANLTSGLQGALFSAVFLLLDPAVRETRAYKQRGLIRKHCLPYINLAEYVNPEPGSGKLDEEGQTEAENPRNEPVKRSCLWWRYYEPKFTKAPGTRRERIAFWTVWVMYGSESALLELDFRMKTNAEGETIKLSAKRQGYMARL